MLKLLWLPFLLMLAAFFIGGAIVGWYAQLAYDDYLHSRVEKAYRHAEKLEVQDYRRGYESGVLSRPKS